MIDEVKTRILDCIAGCYDLDTNYDLNTLLESEVDELTKWPFGRRDAVEHFIFFRKVAKDLSRISRLEEKLRVARGALRQISKDYYRKHGGTLSDWPRSALEECIELDTTTAEHALASLGEIGGKE